MSVFVIVLGILAILAAVAAAIINVYYGSKERTDHSKRNALYAAGALAGLATLFIIVLMIVASMGGGHKSPHRLSSSFIREGDIAGKWL